MHRQGPALPPDASAVPLQTDDDVLQHVEHWIHELEREDDDAPPAALGSEDLPPASVETLRSDWQRLTQTERRIDGDRGSAERHAPAEQRPLRSAGLQTTFTDVIGGSISLAQGDGRLQHRGTVAIRGRCTSVDTACHEIGLPDHVTRAFEFVASWFGFPFDSVNLRSADDAILSWGFWGFAGSELIDCLQQWKRVAPDTFANYLVTFGIDVLPGPTLSVQSDGRAVRGRAAEWAIATDPGLVASLARSGRDAAAQKAQIDVALANWVTPAMFHRWDPSRDADLLTMDVLKSARHVAVLLYLVRRAGRRGSTRLLRTVSERYRPQDEESWLAGLVRTLRSLNREHDSSEVLRISSSPELNRD
jgi:hypothetical protein